jgi:CheY-like chemotaxis protein
MDVRPEPAGFAGCRVLVVEDEFLMAEELRDALEDVGARVLGPAPSVEAALALLDGTPAIDAAILDVKLGGECSFAVADALVARGVPFVFATGYDASALPLAYRGAHRCEKPVDMTTLRHALFN